MFWNLRAVRVRHVAQRLAISNQPHRSRTGTASWQAIHLVTETLTKSQLTPAHPVHPVHRVQATRALLHPRNSHLIETSPLSSRQRLVRVAVRALSALAADTEGRVQYPAACTLTPSQSTQTLHWVSLGLTGLSSDARSTWTSSRH